jgi:HEAT repeat protein
VKWQVPPMTQEHADPRALKERYIARLAALEAARDPGWSPEAEATAWLAGDEVVAEGGAGLEALRLVLADATVSGVTKWMAANSLGKSRHPDAGAILAAALRAAADNDERESLADSLALAGPAAAPAIPELIQLLAEKDYLLRFTAAFALVRIGPASIDPLVAVLFAPPMRRRPEAAEVLGRIRDPRALEPLQAACGDRWPSMRRAAATALGYLSDPRATATLLALLDDANPLVRGSAIEALGKFAGREAIPALTAATTDTTHIRGWEPVATTAKRAIAKIQARSEIVPHS